MVQVVIEIHEAALSEEVPESRKLVVWQLKLLLGDGSLKQVDVLLQAGLQVVLGRFREKIVLIKVKQSCIKGLEDTVVVTDPPRDLWCTCLPVDCFVRRSNWAFHVLLTERLNEASLDVVLGELLIVDLVVVDVARCREICSKLSLQADVLWEQVVVKPFHFAEARLKELKLLLFLLDIFVFHVLQGVQSCKGLFELGVLAQGGGGLLLLELMLLCGRGR